MIFSFNYTYKTYPNSPKATKYSKMLGFATCNTFYAFVTLLIIYFLITFMSAAGISDGVGGVIGIVLFVVAFVVRKRIKTHFEKKIEAIAVADSSFSSFESSSANFKNTNNENTNTNSYTTPTNYSSPTNRNNDVIFDDNQMYIDL